MKKSMKHLVVAALVIMSAFVLSSCLDPMDDMFITTPYEYAQPEGSSVSMINGNVSLVIPGGAVNSNVKISARLCENTENCKFLLKMVKIEPFIKFEKPVTVYLKYDGELANPGISPDGCPLTICYWENEEAYANQLKQKCISCCIDSTGNAVKFSIEQTGLFAVGINNNGEFN